MNLWSIVQGTLYELEVQQENYKKFTSLSVASTRQFNMALFTVFSWDIGCISDYLDLNGNSKWEFLNLDEKTLAEPGWWCLSQIGACRWFQIFLGSRVLCNYCWECWSSIEVQHARGCPNSWRQNSFNCSFSSILLILVPCPKMQESAFLAEDLVDWSSIQSEIFPWHGSSQQTLLKSAHY